ncbi:MAG: double-strand break repair protein AddB [Pseudomonadota bacterium]|nr:double-strand break repair protein AddB [Pseudomonadota bacterium]
MSSTFAKISAVALGKPFLDSLADGLIAKIKNSGPISLANTIIIMPSEKARLNLLTILTVLAKTEALILPRTYTICESLPCKTPHQRGDLDWILPANLLPDRRPIPPISRDLLLAKLIFQWRKAHSHSNSQSLHQCLKLAPTLGTLLDELHACNINYLTLDKSSTTEDASHWASIDKFLKIIAQQWPRILNEQSWLDPVPYDQLITELLIQYWEKNPPKSNIIAAGFTGNLPHITKLLSFIVSLPTGHVVLPSLDRRLDNNTWETLPEDHPQYTIKRLLADLKIENNRVPEWSAQPSHPGSTPQRLPPLHFIPLTFNMGSSPGLSKVDERMARDLTLITCQSLYSESQTISLIIKKFLSNNHGDVSLIAEDQRLIKQVALQLRKWNLDLCHCTPRTSDASDAGTFLHLVAEMICSAVSPVCLLSALKHPMCNGHTSKTLYKDLLNELELKSLRGIRPQPGFSGIMASVKSHSSKDKRVMEWLQELDSASLHFSKLVQRRKVSLKSVLAAHLDFSIWLSQTDKSAETWSCQTDSANGLFQRLNTLYSTLQESFYINGAEYSDIFATLLQRTPKETPLIEGARIYAYNPEQILFSSSPLHILAGMNETSWPWIPQSNRWLSPQMRGALGLPSKERAKGVSSLQLCQAAAAKVVLTRSKIINGVQTAPAYHFAQIENAAKKAGLHASIDQSHYWDDLGQKLERETLNIPQIGRPAPTPPVSARPRTLSVTQIERWMQDPYSIFVSAILKIKGLRAVDAKADPSDYGHMVHETLERFVRTYPKKMPRHALQKLLEFGQDSFKGVRVQPDAYAFWWPRFERLARYFIDQEYKTRTKITTAYAEIIGATTINLASGPFTLTARADRINIGGDGRVDIIDYKTGTLPTTAQIMNGSKPQFLLEALIALDNGFEKIETRTIKSIISIQLSGGSIIGNQLSIEDDIPTKVAQLSSKVKELIASFDDVKTPYYFLPHRDFAPQNNEFVHLARMKEWPAIPQKCGPEE